MDTEPTTWHFGLMARWWVEFSVAEADELAFFSDCASDAGGRILDLGCGTGRLLIPLLRHGFDVDGCDLSIDMIEQCRAAAGSEGLTARLYTQAMHRLDLPDLYRTIYICGSFGIGGNREHDREALRRCHHHLESGGRLVFNQFQPYSNTKAWSYWAPENRRGLPRPWPEEGTRRRAADGDELELRTRLFAVEPLEQRDPRELRHPLAEW